MQIESHIFGQLALHWPLNHSQILLHLFLPRYPSLVGLLGYSLLQGKTTGVTDDINEVTVQVVNLVTSHRAQMQPTA